MFFINLGLNFLLFLPKYFFFFALLFLLTFSAIYREKKNIYKITLYSLLSIFFLVFILEANATVFVFNSFLELFISNLYTSSLSMYLLVLASLFLLAIANTNIANESIKSFEYILLIGFSIFGLSVLIICNHFLGFYLCLELQSLSLYILASFNYFRNYSAEAGIKYFILGAISSGLILFGISLIYGITGILNFSDLFELGHFISLDTSYTGNLTIALVLLVSGLFFKLGAVPFHLWLPDVYEGAPIITTAFFAVVPKIMIVGFLTKLFFFFNILPNFYMIFYFSGILSIIVGSLGALYQEKLKRIIAYSAINHIGFVLLGLSSGTFNGFFSSFLYLFIYSLISLNLFIIMFSLKNSNGTIMNKLNNLIYLKKSNPTLAFSFAILLFSLAGIPPLMGFFNKLFILLSLSLTNNLYFLLIIVVFSSISSFYYIRMIKMLLFDFNKNYSYVMVPDKIKSYLISSLLIFNLCFIMFANIILSSINSIVITF